MPTYNMPQRREQKDPLDTILKGLNIAANIYGIKEASDKSRLLAKQSQMEQDRADAAEFAEAEKVDLEQQKMAEAKNRDDRDFDLRERMVKVAELNAKNKGGGLRPPGSSGLAESAEQPFKALPRDQQIEVENLSTKIAGRKQIKNDIEAAITQLDDPNIPEDQKVSIGLELAKTLNSLQGADAISSEESARLLGRLEFKMLNFTNPGAFIGRDLEGFTEQVKNNRDRITKSIELSQSRVDELLGRRPMNAQTVKPQINMNNTAGSLNVFSTPAANASDNLPSMQFTADEIMAETIRRNGLKKAPLPGR